MMSTENGPVETQDKVPEQPSDAESTSDTQMVDAPEARQSESELGPQVLPHTTAKDRTLREFLGMMDQYAPIVC